MVKPLTVYKASAGSGKTFTLATEYIKLLVLNPTNYRHILAVTFTNKATEEMKMRILSQLYGIWKQLPDSADYLAHVTQATALPSQTVSTRAGEALHLLLHNYNYFRVETIDTFFQSILRNLARELDLTANLRIGLNDTQVEEQAVDQLIDSLTHTDIMLQWIMKYIMENIKDDKPWNIIGQVKQFGRTIFREEYKVRSTELNEVIARKGFMEGFMTQMRQIRSTAEKRMMEQADEFFTILDNEGMTVDDLSYGKTGVASFFLKLRNGQMSEDIVGKRVTDCLENPSKWYSKKHPLAERIHMLADSTLIPLLRRTVEARPRQWKLYASADLTLRHLNQLRLLGSIEQKVRQMNDEANRFLLSDTQQLLHALIKDSDSPFIFEKIGTQLEHVMIDEFQDTSSIQWQNFKVLLQECMSHADTENLIVGDVKQSIYRWRSGDWRLLNAIDKEFPHGEDKIDILPLETNYRSERRVVAFNNAFFTEAAQQEYLAQREDYPAGAEELRHAYEDVVQRIPQHKDDSGYVDIRLLQKDDYQEQTLVSIIDIIDTLLRQGYSPERIAILVRTNKTIPLIADYFAVHRPDIHIVSDEAFRLDASISVCIMVQALHLLTHPDDLLAKATICKLYQRGVLGNTVPESELLIRGRDMDGLLPEDFTQHTTELLQLPLYELTERLYTIFRLKELKEQSAYVCAFYDQLNLFVQDNSTDIDAFVNEWEETLCNKTIQGSKTNGIRILSIHKSKGLEYDHVIIPYADWRMEHGNILWCQPTEVPFNALPIVPVDYSKGKMMGSVFEYQYLDEHLQNTVDNLNLLYVAFTRARKSLFVIGQRGASTTRAALIESVLPKLHLEGSTLGGIDDADAPITFSFGEIKSGKSGKAGHQPHADHNTEHTSPPTSSNNVFLQPVTPVSIMLETFGIKNAFKQSNKSKDFVSGDDEQAQMSYIKTGSVLHNIFSTIRTSADIPQALQQLQQEGILYNDEVTREKVTSLLHNRLEDKHVKNWFSDHWKLFNECTILTLEDGKMKERRPDRVMTDGEHTHVVDFKFGKPKAEYHQQVREYMQLLRDMDMPDVKGWLWYVYSNKIEEVK